MNVILVPTRLWQAPAAAVQGYRAGFGEPGLSSECKMSPNEVGAFSATTLEEKKELVKKATLFSWTAYKK
jgi:hypothetical protein